MIILAYKPGQLGNRLIMHANLVAFSKAYGIPVKNFSIDEYASYFEGFVNNAWAAYPSTQKGIKSFSYNHLLFKWVNFLAKVCIKLKTDNHFISVMEIDWKEEVNMDGALFVAKARKVKFLLLYGWKFRSATSLEKFKEEVKPVFKPIEKYYTPCLSRFSKIRKSEKCRDAVIIGVHIRQGDYSWFEGGKYFYQTSDYIRIMKEITEMTSQKIVYYICSNEVQDKSLFTGLNTEWSKGSFMDDFISLSLCDRIIGPPSTFSMWASYYGNTLLKILYTKEEKFEWNSFEVYPIWKA